MSANCGGSFYDALGGKHRSGSATVEVKGANGNTAVLSVVSGVRAREGEIEVEDLAKFGVMRLNVAGVQAPIPFSPEAFRGKLARKRFDPEVAKEVLGESYVPWLYHVAKSLPVAPSESRRYCVDVSREVYKNTSAVGVSHLLKASPGLLGAGPDVILENYFGNRGVVDAALLVAAAGMSKNPSKAELKNLLSFIDAGFDGDVKSEARIAAISAMGLLDENFQDLGHEEAVSQMERKYGMEGLSGYGGILGLYYGESTRLKNINSDESIAAQAAVDRRAAPVTNALVEKYNLVSYATKVRLSREIAGENRGMPVYGKGDNEPLAEYRMVGVAASGRVFSYVSSDYDSGSNPGRISADIDVNVAWHPSVEDALRGTRVDSQGHEKLVNIMSEVIKIAPTSEERAAVTESFDELVSGGGDNDFLRATRGRMLASATDYSFIL